MSRYSENMLERQFLDWFEKCFPGEALRLPYPARRCDGGTYVLTKMSDLAETRAMMKADPPPLPCAAVVVMDAPGTDPPTGKFVGMNLTTVRKYQNNGKGRVEALEGFPMPVESVNETWRAMEELRRLRGLRVKNEIMRDKKDVNTEHNIDFIDRRGYYP